MNNDLSRPLVITEKSLKRHTKRLQQEMLHYKEDFKLSEAQNMLAKIFGTKDFHELNSIIKNTADITVEENLKVNMVPLPAYWQESIDFLASFKPMWEKQYISLNEVNTNYLNMLSDIMYHFCHIYSTEDSGIQHIRNKEKTWNLLQYAIKYENEINFDLFNKEGYNLLELVLTCDIETPFMFELITKTCVNKHLYINDNVLCLAIFKKNKKIIYAIIDKIKKETLLEKKLYQKILNYMFFNPLKMDIIHYFLDKLNVDNIDYNEIFDSHTFIEQFVFYTNSTTTKKERNINELLIFLSKNNYKLPDNISESLFNNIERYNRDIKHCLEHFNNQTSAKQKKFNNMLIEYHSKIKIVIEKISKIYPFEVAENLLIYSEKYQ